MSTRDVSGRASSPELVIRVGCDLTFECSAAVTALLIIRPRSTPDHRVWKEELQFRPNSPHEEFLDAYGNAVQRINLAPGQNQIRHDALVKMTAAFDRPHQIGKQASINSLPAGLFRFCVEAFRQHRRGSGACAGDMRLAPPEH
jgi:hypothetical protein